MIYDLDVYTDSLSPTILNTRLMEGYIVGNEAPGVTKYSDLYSDGNLVSIGMKPSSQQYATEIQLAPDEEFIAPAVFLLFFIGEPEPAKEILARFTTEHLAWSKSDYSVWY